MRFTPWVPTSHSPERLICCYLKLMLKINWSCSLIFQQRGPSDLVRHRRETIRDTTSLITATCDLNNTTWKVYLKINRPVITPLKAAVSASLIPWRRPMILAYTGVGPPPTCVFFSMCLSHIRFYTKKL